MPQRIARWLAGAVLALALAIELIAGGSNVPVVFGADPTPTPTAGHGDGNPGGHGGGG